MSKENAKEAKVIAKARASREELKRLIRSPMALSDRFGVKDDENYVYRVVLANSEHDPHKVERFEKFGYEIVDDPKNHGQSRSGDPSRQGSSTLRKTVRHEEFVVMRIPRELYNENQALKKEVYEDQLSLDGNRQKQKISKSRDSIEIDGGVIDMNTPLHKNE